MKWAWLTAVAGGVVIGLAVGLTYVTSQLAGKP